MDWKFTGSKPVYQQIMEHFRAAVLAGEYPPGGRGPSVRELAAEARVNPNTVQKVLALLEQDGLVISNGTKGRFVTENTEVISNIKLLLQTEYLQSVRESAARLGITKQQFMQFLQESEDKDE